MAATVAQAFVAALKASVGPFVRNRVWTSAEEDPKHVGIPRLVVRHTGSEPSMTTETFCRVERVEVRAEDRDLPQAEALSARVSALFEPGAPAIAVDGVSVTWLKEAGYRVEKVEGARREDGVFRHAAVTTWSVRTERPRPVPQGG
jgi:hypothetical protein